MDTFMPDKALQVLQAVEARYFRLEPGDNTRYEFIVGYIGLSSPDEYFCMGVGGAKFPYAVFDGQDIRDYIKRHPKWNYREQQRGSCIADVNDPNQMDPWIDSCIIDLQVNPCTVVAAVMAVNHFMEAEVK